MTDSAHLDALAERVGGRLDGVLHAIGFAPKAGPASRRCCTLLLNGYRGTYLPKPPRSWTLLPLGESDHPESKHWDDQAEKLFSKSRMKPTYFLNKEELLKHVESTKVLRWDRD